MIDPACTGYLRFLHYNARLALASMSATQNLLKLALPFNPTHSQVRAQPQCFGFFGGSGGMPPDWALRLMPKKSSTYQRKHVSQSVSHSYLSIWPNLQCTVKWRGHNLFVPKHGRQTPRMWSLHASKSTSVTCRTTSHRKTWSAIIYQERN
jgi:hypothetical protein